MHPNHGAKCTICRLFLCTYSSSHTVPAPQLGSPVQAMWLLKLAKQEDSAAQRAFAHIPDFVIRDMTAWLSFVIRSGQPDLVAACRLDVLIAFLVEMLQRGSLVQSPIIHAKIVELLLTMLLPGQSGRRRGTGTTNISEARVMHKYVACKECGAAAAGAVWAAQRQRCQPLQCKTVAMQPRHACDVPTLQGGLESGKW